MGRSSSSCDRKYQVSKIHFLCFQSSFHKYTKLPDVNCVFPQKKGKKYLQFPYVISVNLLLLRLEQARLLDCNKFKAILSELVMIFSDVSRLQTSLVWFVSYVSAKMKLAIWIESVIVLWRVCENSCKRIFSQTNILQNDS